MITLNKNQKEDIFHSALCNGLSEIIYHGIDLDYNKEEYLFAKKQLSNGDNFICYEDVLLQMLKNGNALLINDFEGDGCYNTSLSIESMYDRIDRVPTTVLLQFLEGQDDAWSADAVLQVCFFNEIIFG